MPVKIANSHRYLNYIFLIILMMHLNLAAQVGNDLPKSDPEKEGVSSAGIADFLNAVSASRNELHGIVIVRHGKVITEAWASPYADSLKHTMYSTSKSFTATAVGLAIAEKKLKLTDKVVSFFPDLLPDTMSNHLKSLNVQHLLTMTVGHATDPSGTINRGKEWVKHFLATPVAETPGTKFLYNSMATYMLSAIVQKVTGQKVIDYLEPRLFKPLGITNKDWENSPEGINVGGWGLRISTMDMAKFGQLFLQKGRWKGKQVIPASWITDASKAHIIQNPAASSTERAASDWLQGYGYQFWRSRNNSYRADGAFGQYILIFPELDAVIAITSETPDMQDELNLVWKHLYPAIGKSAIPQTDAARNRLTDAIEGLKIKPFPPLPDSAVNVSMSLVDKTIALEPNKHGFTRLDFGQKESLITLRVSTEKGDFSFRFDNRNWAADTTSLQGPALTENATGSMAGIGPVKVAGSYSWMGPQTLELIVQYIESPHREIWTCHFTGESFRMEIRNSIAIMRTDTIEETLVGKSD